MSAAQRPTSRSSWHQRVRSNTATTLNKAHSPHTYRAGKRKGTSTKSQSHGVSTLLPELSPATALPADSGVVWRPQPGDNGQGGVISKSPAVIDVGQAVMLNPASRGIPSRRAGRGRRRRCASRRRWRGSIMHRSCMHRRGSRGWGRDNHKRANLSRRTRTSRKMAIGPNSLSCRGCCASHADTHLLTGRWGKLC